jgi:hypothetical protein
MSIGANYSGSVKIGYPVKVDQLVNRQPYSLPPSAVISPISSP